MTNLKSGKNRVNQIFTPNAFFSLLRCATWYYNDIYILFTYFAYSIGYEDDILEVISNLEVEGGKFGRKKDKCSLGSYRDT